VQKHRLPLFFLCSKTKTGNALRSHCPPSLININA
jgi:hypothetical protein